MNDLTLIERYTEHLTHVCSYASGTVSVHHRVCRNWSAFLGQERGRTLADAFPEDLLAWIAQREATGVKDSTIAADLCVFRTLHRYLHSSGLAGHNPAASLPEYVCNPPAETQVLTVHECFRILESFNTQAPLDLRNYTIVALLWSTGLRNSELCALRWGDIDLSDAHLIVRKGKGGKQRQIFLNDRLCDDLRRYRQELCPDDGPGEPLFYAFTVNAPEAEDFRPLSTRQVNAVVREQARKVGITKRVNPLVFRHTFATHMLEAGVDIEDIKEMLGHDDATETTVYLHVTMAAAKGFLNDHIAKPHKYR